MTCGITEAPRDWDQVLALGLESIWPGGREEFDEWQVEGDARIAEAEAEADDE